MKKLLALSMVFLGIMLTASCDEAPHGQAPPDDADPESAAKGALGQHMGWHFERVTAIQEALIRGELEGIVEPARWLESHPAAIGLPEGWTPFVDDMRSMARLTREAKTFKAAGAAIAGMARTCGECHAAMAAEPRIPELGSKGLPPADQIDTVPRMLRHRWAMEQMWVGLINPSEVSWSRGVEVLANAPLQPKKMMEEAGFSADIAALAHTVHQAGDDAREAADWSTRARIYGRLLSTCADCHRKSGLDSSCVEPLQDYRLSANPNKSQMKLNPAIA